MLEFPPQIGWPLRRYRLVAAVLFALLLIQIAGCSRFHSMSTPEYVYVTPKQMFLRDRVAVVANRVGEVTNGERLEVLEHGARFLRVKAPGGASGWLESHAVIDQQEYDKFQLLAKQHAGQKPVAKAILYNELYMHIAPGRKTQRFYLLPPNAKVFLLERASVPRNTAANVLGLPMSAGASENHAKAVGHKRTAGRPRARGNTQNFAAQFEPVVPMEDWWLVRDAAGQTGWMLSRDLQVDVPDDVAQYAENEKMIGAYVLRTVDDPDSGQPNGKVPEYVTVLTPYKEGLPYDFDQVRVFTWDTRRHRYGTAFRLRDIAGFFPVKVTPGDPNSPAGPEPVFSFQVAQGNAVSLDPATGRAHAAQLQTMTFRMEGNLVRRVGPAGASTGSASGRPAARRRAARRHRSRE